ncbi:MAG: hypothetical protein QMD16_16535 [Desulfitobacteriaceae bacterium]|nr:hypothetical protein [Desulfitobacteriaceae bacterium]
MRKVWLFILLAVLAAIVVMGCGNQQVTAPASNTQKSSAYIQKIVYHHSSTERCRLLKDWHQKNKISTFVGGRMVKKLDKTTGGNYV